MNNFGDLLFYHRNYVGLSLRQFADLVEYDASNVRKIEKGTLSAPKDEKTLRKWAKAVGLGPNSVVTADFVAAGLADGMCRQIKPGQDVEKLLPAFCSIIESRHLEPDTYKQLVEVLKRNAKYL